MQTYYDVKEMLKEELQDIVKKGELSAGSLDTVDKLLHSIKNACKIIMYEEYAEDGYSYSDADTDMTHYSYARDGQRRDSRGRYSRSRDGRRYSRESGYSYHDDKERIEILREMKDDAKTEDERRVIDKIIHRMERE